MHSTASRALLAVGVAAILMVAVPDVAARGYPHTSWHSARSHTQHSITSGKKRHVSSHRHAATLHSHHGRAHGHLLKHASSGVARDRHGRIKRSAEAKKAFLRAHGLSHVPKGYEVDHIVPLCAGGADDPSNMQLLTKEEHRAKTKRDIEACRRR